MAKKNDKKSVEDDGKVKETITVDGKEMTISREPMADADVPEMIDYSLVVRHASGTYYPVNGVLKPVLLIDENFDEEREAARKKSGIKDDLPAPPPPTQEKKSVAKIVNRK